MMSRALGVIGDGDGPGAAAMRATAAFYLSQILPAHAGHAAAVTAGSSDVMALPAEMF